MCKEVGARAKRVCDIEEEEERVAGEKRGPLSIHGLVAVGELLL